MMKIADKPHNEQLRLKYLKELKILDSASERCFDELTELAAAICEVPICLISLIDQDRQWFKSHYGLAVRETPRDYAFCSHAILQDELFEVKNSREDERFKDNPLVTADPQVVFYAGMPLAVEQEINLGTLCVIDHRPKELTDFQRRGLEILAHQVSHQLKLRASILKISKARSQFEAIALLSDCKEQVNNPLAVAMGNLETIKSSIPEQKFNKIHASLKLIASSLEGALKDLKEE